MAIESKKKIILITIVTSVLLAGLIILLVISATSKKPKSDELTDTPVVATTDTAVDGEFVLEEEKADPTSASIATEETPTAETASALPKTGPSDLLAFAVFAGALTTYLSSLRFKNSTA